LGTDPEYVDYIQQHQQKAIDELVGLGVIKATDRETFLLQAEDFVPWEGPIS
jgi:hypothetical protein